MAATLTQERFNGSEWIFERKFDGIRLLAYKKGSRVELFSRNRLPQTIPALARAIAKLPHQELILDGEIDWPHETQGPAAYHLFDIMWIDGRDLTSLPLEERRALLRKLPLAAPLHRVTELHDEAPWERAQKHGWEGVIAKRRDSVYEQRRSPNWLKMKCELAQEFVVGGFTEFRFHLPTVAVAVLVETRYRFSNPAAIFPWSFSFPNKSCRMCSRNKCFPLLIGAPQLGGEMSTSIM
jgi:bifunctional non-homologous end joining protein LigD